MPEDKPESQVLTEARRHHYSFAHSALRQYTQNDPLEVFGIMGSPDRDKFVSFLWQRVCEHCDGDEATDLRASDVGVTTTLMMDRPTIFVEMPRVKAVTEALYVAVVLTRGTIGGGPQEDVAFRYFTLELGLDNDGRGMTFLCEWDGDIHRNLGAGPQPDPRAFLDEVARHLSLQ